MPAFVTTFLTLLTTYWPFLLALGALGTAFNQFASKVFPGTRFANIVNTITVDFVNLLAEVGGLLGVGPRATPKGKPPVNVLLILAALMLFACSSFLHFSSPTAEADTQAACTALENGDATFLTAYAQTRGVDLTDIVHDLDLLCAARGTTAVKARLLEMHAEFLPGDGGHP